MKKGSIFIVVLWMIFFLGLLIIAIKVYLNPVVNVTDRLKENFYLGQLAKSGIKATVSVIQNDPTPSYDALKDEWCSSKQLFENVSLEYGYFDIIHMNNTGKIRYGMLDENRKINLNKSSFSVLQKLVELTTELNNFETEQIADSILDWIDEDDEPRDKGAESSYYLNKSKPYYCKNSSFQIIEELLLVKGIDNDIFNKIKDYVTVYTGTNTKVNINTADVVVLRCIGISEIYSDMIVKYREGFDGVEGTEDDNVFISIEDVRAKFMEWNIPVEEIDAFIGFVDVRSDVFSGISIGRIGDDSREIEFVINRNAVIKSWKGN